jgi:cytochrome d ubiquinol oxidase subunit I
VLSLWSGDGSAYEVAKVQPMKLAAMEGLYNGKCSCGLTAIGILNPNKQVNDTTENTFLAKIEIPSMLSILATRDSKGFVPGINDIVAGGYKTPDGTKALSVTDKMAMGKTAISALSAYQAAKKAGYQEGSALAYHVFKASADNIGYGYLSKPEDAVPNVPMTFYSFHLMVMLGGYFILFFLVMTFIAFKRDISKIRWMQWVSLWSIPLAYIAGMAGWIVAEVGRQPWTIQDMLPSNAAISRLATGSVKVTFFIFVIIFTVLLIAGIKILCKAINKGPQIEPEV